MWLTRAALFSGLAGVAAGLLVAPDSPCAQYCGNVLSNTTGADMVCPDSSFTSSTVFETCIDCELTSGYTYGNESDLQWLIYNLRYAVSYCLFGIENTNAQDNPCGTETACGPLEDAFDYRNLTQAAGTYDYCQDWIENSVTKCTSCLDNSDMSYLSNYVIVMDTACSQLPSPGATLSVAGTPFTSTHMNATTPSASPLYTFTPSTSPVSLGGKVGIVIGGIVFLLFLAGVAIVCTGRRRRRAYLRSVAARYAGKNPMAWPSPPPPGGGSGYGGYGSGNGSGDVFDTPMSQRPLRGWDAPSPESAGGADSGGSGAFPRYFSPYSSQYNSPVSAASEGGPGHHVWPTQTMIASAFGPSGSGSGSGGGSGMGATVDADSPAANLAPPPAPYYYNSTGAGSAEQQILIGMALGDMDPNMHSRPVNGSLGGGGGGPAAALPLSSSSSSSSASPHKPGVENYELSEMQHANAYAQQQQQQQQQQHELQHQPPPPPPLANQAPLLQHPGYGRGSIKYYPPPPQPQWEPVQPQAQAQAQPQPFFTEGTDNGR